MLTYLAIFLGPALIGLPLAAWGYRWKQPAIRPYVWFVLALAAPLASLFVLQALFTLPPGTCVNRPLNYAPFLLGIGSVVLAIALIAGARGYRRFVAGLAIALLPPTLLWSLVTIMSLAGCWI